MFLADSGVAEKVKEERDRMTREAFDEYNESSFGMSTWEVFWRKRHSGFWSAAANNAWKALDQSSHVKYEAMAEKKAMEQMKDGKKHTRMYVALLLVSILFSLAFLLK